MLKPIWFLSPDDGAGSGTADAGSATAQNQGAENNATATPEDNAGNGSSAETQNTDTNQSGNEAGGKNKGSENRIPYDRFQQVNNNWREESALRAKAEAELSFLKEQMNAAKQSPGTQLDPEVQKSVDFYKPLLVGKDLEKTNQRIEKLEHDLKARDESQKLEKAIGEMETRYPAIKDAPYAKNMLTNEYILNPKANLDEMAKGINDFLTNRDKKTISEYVKGKQTASQHKGASPSGSGPANKPAPSPKNASFNDLMNNARDRGVARLENADK